MVSGVLSAQVKSGGTAWISVKSVDLKASTWFFAGTNGTLAIGDQVTVLRISGDWAEVRSAANTSLSGWTALNSLSSRQIVASGRGASDTEVALAAKGFNQEVEDNYRTQGSYNYDAVDKIEAITVSQDELLAFINDGRLSTGE